MMEKWTVFFFQAEDGIRDYKVTGVQTCALPIWKDFRAPAPPNDAATQAELAWIRDVAVASQDPGIVNSISFWGAGAPAYRWIEMIRSEERRVGKECRSRWSPYH